MEKQAKKLNGNPEPAEGLNKFQGVVVSDIQDKTVVVEVVSPKMHAKYHKQYQRTKKYQVHDEKNKYQKGDLVEFVPCAPKSRAKRWRIVGKVKK